MILEVREVSRKTPRDGRLEITESSARRLAALGRFAVEVDLQRSEGTIAAIACHCEKGGGTTGHMHHFVEATLLTALVAGETVVLELLDGPVLSVERAHPLRPE